MPRSPYTLDAPDLRWDDDQPVSVAHDDVYNPFLGGEFGAACATHTFLDGVGVPDRWRRHPGVFTLGELGFGAALNFILTLDAWANRPGPGFLSYVAVEHQPLDAVQLRRALRPWSNRAGVRELLDRCPPPLRGTFRLSFPIHRAELVLLYDDAVAALQSHDFRADAWYLDGFAPSRNPSIWSDEVCALVGARSRPGAVFATYSAAGAVRRRLDAAGFDVKKSPGFGAKAERLTGVRRVDAPGVPDPTPPRHVAVIGAGIAGVAVAAGLAERGVRATLIERRDAPAREASAIPCGLAHPYFTVEPTPKTTRLLTGLHHLRQLLHGLTHDPEVWRACPVLHLAAARRIERLLEHLPELGLPETFLRGVDVSEARAISGWPVNLPATYAAHGLSVSIPRVCAALLSRAGDGVDVRLNTAALRLESTAAGAVRIAGDDGVVTEADAVVLANGLDAQRMLGDAVTPTHVAHGHVAAVRFSGDWSPPRTAICFGAYAAPDGGGVHLGGGYWRAPRDDMAAADDLIDALTARVDGLTRTDVAVESVIAGGRATTFDRAPVVGRLADRVYVSVGHGSNGLMTGPLGAAMLAAQMTGGAAPADGATAQAMRPDRRPRREVS